MVAYPISGALRWILENNEDIVMNDWSSYPLVLVARASRMRCILFIYSDWMTWRGKSHSESDSRSFTSRVKRVVATRVTCQFSHVVLPVYQRYEIVFLSSHSLGPQLSHAAVAKEIGCSKSTVKYWLQRWKQSKDLTDTSRSGRRRMTIPKQDQRILSLAEEQTFVTARDVAHRMKRKRVEISERTVRRRLKEAGAKYNRPIAKSLLTERHRENRLKWAQEHQATN